MEEPTVEMTEESAPSEPRRPFQLDRRWLILIPALVALLVYLPAMNYQLVWDDGIFLRDSPIYRAGNLWLSAIFKPFLLSPNYFRPLALLTFAIELHVGGGPGLMHITNMVLHALNTALVALLLIQLWGKDSEEHRWRSTAWALGLSLLYAVHPALIEGVAFISSRFDLLMTALLLVAMLVDLTMRDAESRTSRAILVGLFFLLAALAKEMAVALALVLPLWHLATRSGEKSPLPWWKRIVRNGDLFVYLSVFVGGLLYLLIRLISLGYILYLVPGKSVAAGSFLPHLLLVFKSLAAYILLILAPFGWVAPIHYSTLPLPLSDWTAWASIALVGLAIFGLVMLLRRNRPVGWLVLAGLVTLLPVANIQPLELGGGAFIAERYLLFPLIFFVLAVGMLLRPQEVEATAPRALPFLKRAVPALWLITALAVVQVTLPNWRDEMSLWTWGNRRAPLSATPLTNLSLQYTNAGALQQGIDLAQRATELDPQDGDGWDNLGLALFYTGQYTDALGAFEQAATVEPSSALYWNNVAGSLRELGRLAEAEQVLLDKVLTLDPNLPVAYLNLSIIYLRADRPDFAEQSAQRALALLPAEQAQQAQNLYDQSQAPDAWLRLGDLMLSQHNFQGALAAFDRAYKLGAKPADVAAGRSSASIQMQDWNSAAQVLTWALEQAPDDPRLYNNMGVVARETGDLEKAREYFTKASELAPNWELPKQNLAGLDQQKP